MTWVARSSWIRAATIAAWKSFAGSVRGRTNQLAETWFFVHSHNAAAAVVMVQSLRRHGYQAVYRPFGIDALEWFSEKPDENDDEVAARTGPITPGFKHSSRLGPVRRFPRLRLLPFLLPPKRAG